uniref:MHC class I-like antigen recognition-like domain-containing protein n=1 Tax=Neovison vison TaxID=452646 RepID=A0A8C7AKK2_NEOVI
MCTSRGILILSQKGKGASLYTGGAAVRGQSLLLLPHILLLSPEWQRGACCSFSSSTNLHLCFSFPDALLLSYNFSITSQARPGQPWCEIQGQVNGNEFLYYARGSKWVISVGPWGMKLKDTAFWDTQMETLEDLGEELRKKLLDIKAEIFTKNSLTMQGWLMCERGADGHSRGSWQFVFNEQLTCLFDPENRKWIQFPPGGQQVKDKLDSDRELTELLMKIANGDCKRWLQKLREHRAPGMDNTLAWGRAAGGCT